MNSVVQTIKNFSREIAILPLALFISYIKIAPSFDESVKAVFFPESDMLHYLMYAAGITAVIYIVSAIFVREVEMTKEHERECAETDGKILLIYFAILFLYIFYTYFGVHVFKSEGAGFFACLIFMAINFGAVVPSVIYQVSQFDNENKPLPRGDNLSFPRLMKQPKFWLICMTGFGIIGVCYSMNDYDAF